MAGGMSAQTNGMQTSQQKNKLKNMRKRYLIAMVAVIAVIAVIAVALNPTRSELLQKKLVVETAKQLTTGMMNMSKWYVDVSKDHSKNLRIELKMFMARTNLV